MSLLSSLLEFLHIKGLAETKVVVSGSTFLLLLYRRDAATALFLLGAISNALLSKILKRLINASRPTGAQLEDPGMPSSHAQSLFFFAAFLASGAQIWSMPSSFELSPMQTVQLRAAASLAIVALAAMLTLLRVRAGLHTMAQISVGAVIGAANGASWFRTSPALLEWVASRQLGGNAPVALLLVVGALVVGSVERTIARVLKAKGRAAKKE